MFEKLSDHRFFNTDGHEVWNIDRHHIGYRDDVREVVAGVERAPGFIAIYESIFEWTRGEPRAEIAASDRKLILSRMAEAMRFGGYSAEIVEEQDS
jgi:hypothetical protein